MYFFFLLKDDFCRQAMKILILQNLIKIKIAPYSTAILLNTRKVTYKYVCVPGCLRAHVLA